MFTIEKHIFICFDQYRFLFRVFFFFLKKKYGKKKLVSSFFYVIFQNQRAFKKINEFEHWESCINQHIYDYENQN